MTRGRFGLILRRMGTVTTTDGMSERLARRSILVGSVTLALVAAGGRFGASASKPTITVHKPPT